jgi:hypothetical protein
MGDRYLLDLADVLRAAGLDVIEVDGWPHIARGSGGYSSGLPNHVMVHHTASGPSSDGWPDVEYMTYQADAAPLTNLYLNRAGTVWVCAGGATNTNGSGIDPCATIADDTMNASAIGIEAANDGIGERWPDAQLDAYETLCRALCAAYGIPTWRIHGHAEYAPGRKIDPAGPPRYATGADTWRMDDFRATVDQPTPEPRPPEDFDMDSFLIRHTDQGWHALVYGDGKVTGIDNGNTGPWIARFGDPLPAPPPIWDDFTSKSG